MFWLWWVGAAIAAAFVVAIVWDDILEWMQGEKVKDSAYGMLIKERLDNGNYRVVGGVFSKSGKVRAEQAWESDELDDDLEEMFGSKKKIRVSI